MTKEEMVQFAMKSDDTVENTMWKIYQQGREDERLRAFGAGFASGYEKGKEYAIDECIEILKDTSRRNCSHLLDEIVYRAIEQMENLKE